MLVELQITEMHGTGVKMSLEMSRGTNKRRIWMGRRLMACAAADCSRVENRTVSILMGLLVKRMDLKQIKAHTFHISSSKHNNMKTAKTLSHCCCTLKRQYQMILYWKINCEQIKFVECSVSEYFVLHCHLNIHKLQSTVSFPVVLRNLAVTQIQNCLNTEVCCGCLYCEESCNKQLDEAA